MPLPKTFCPLPWKHFFVNIGGEVQVCCTSEERDNNVRKDDGSWLNIEDVTSVDETMNLKFMKNLRRQLLNDEWPEFCFRCEETEKNGGKSRRQFEIERYEGRNEDMIGSTAADGGLTKGMNFIDLRLGNTCNLSCRMCTPRSSSKWLQEWADLDVRSVNIPDEVLPALKRQTWYKDAMAFEKILDASEEVEYLHFAGGEPLIIPAMKQFLRGLVDKGYSKNIRLSYNTNFTVISDDLVELWKEFHGVHLYISVDAFGSTNDYIRAHSQWEKMAANLERLDQSFHDWNISEAMFCTTVQALNVLRLDELYNYTLKFKNIRRLPHLVLLHWPTTFAVQVLPKHLRMEAKKRLLALKARLANFEFRPDEIGYMQDFDEVLSFLEKDDSHLWARFLQENLAMDRVKAQNMADVYPEFIFPRELAL